RAGLQGEPLRRARGDRPLPAREGRAASRAADRAGGALRRRGRRAGRARAGRARPARPARAPPVRRPRRSRARRRDARRVPGGARRREHRHQRPLPPGAPSDGVSRAAPRPAAAARRRARGRGGVLAAALGGALGAGHPGRDRRAPPRARRVYRRVRRRAIRVVATLVVTGLCAVYIVWKIDVGKTLDVLRGANVGYFLGSVAIMVVTVLPMAWRWQQLLAGRGIHDRLPWLTRAYFTAYTAGQVLPTSIGGDAMRIFETTRRHPGHGGPIAGSVLLERALGGAATLALAAIGFVLAIGRYDVGAYLWVELAFVVATLVLGVVLFSRRMRRPLRRTVPLLRRLRVERPLRAVYEGIHAYRNHGWLLLGVCVLTLGVQAVRVLAIWLSAKAVGVDLSPRVYYVMGPLLFLVMLVPFTINGLAVREAFFVSFLGKLDVGADP